MNRSEALKVVRSYPDDQVVSDLYEHDDAFADALNDLFPGTFEYPDFSHRKVSEVVRMAEKNQERFEFTDAFSDAKYSFKTIEEMMSKCDELGSSRFLVVRQDDTFIQVNKVDGKWARDDDPSVVRRQIEANALTLAADLDKRIRVELEEYLHDVLPMPDAVRMAYQTMGVDPREDSEKRAMRRIEGRSIAFTNAATVAKAALIDDPLYLNVRLQAMRELKVVVLSPEVAGMWAEVDVRDFGKIFQGSWDREEYAASLMMTNMESNAEYKAALIEKFPFVAASVTALDRESERKIAAKAERKDAEMQSIDDICNRSKFKAADKNYVLYFPNGSMKAAGNKAHIEKYFKPGDVVVAPRGDYVITKDANSGMVGLSKAGESTVINFGGIPAIQTFAKENPDVPVRVINELLARDGGYTGFRDARDDNGDYVLLHPDDNRWIIDASENVVWARAAKSAVRYSELLKAERNNQSANDEPGFEEAELSSSCRP